MGATLLLGVADQLTLTLKETTTIHKLITRATKRKTSARRATLRRGQTKASTITKITFRYGGIGAYGGMRK